MDSAHEVSARRFTPRKFATRFDPVCYTHSMPLDVNAVVLENRRLSEHYSVLVLDAPPIAAATQPGQFVMLKPSHGTDPLLRRPFSVFEVLRNADGAPSGISILNKKTGVGTSLLYDVEPGATIACLGPLGRPFEAVPPPAEAWMVAGGVGLAPFVTLATRLQQLGTPTTLFYGARTASELYYVDLFERLGVHTVLATEDGSRGTTGRVTGPLADELQASGRGRGDSPIRVRPDANDARRRAARRTAPARLRRLARTGDGLRHGRLLQLRGADARSAARRPALRPLVRRRSRLRLAPHRLGGADSLTPDLSVSIGAWRLTNPLIAASGCFGYGVEYADAVDLASLGGVAVKGLFLKEREGHPPPRIVETPSGMLNAIGLQGIGVHRFVAEKLPELRALRAAVLVNICGTTIDEYVELARILSDAEGVAALELNISCPNIKEGGITFGCSLTGTHAVVSAVRKVTRLPVIPKLTPNVTDVASFARAAEEAGADAVSLVNTFLAMAIDVETRRPRLSNIVGGLSGPAIRPIAVRMVYECRQAVRLPIIGMGGIATASDVLEFLIAGANAVQVGTANFVDPLLWPKLLTGLEEYMQRHGLTRIAELTGTLDTSREEHAWISS